MWHGDLSLLPDQLRGWGRSHLLDEASSVSYITYWCYDLAKARQSTAGLYKLPLGKGLQKANSTGRLPHHPPVTLVFGKCVL